MPKKSRKVGVGKAATKTNKLPKSNASAVAKRSGLRGSCGSSVEASRDRCVRQNWIRAVQGCEGGSSRHHASGIVRAMWAELTVVNEKPLPQSEQAARLLLFGSFPDCFYFFAGWT
jgi:hypothetical protein